MGVKRLVSADSESGELPLVVSTYLQDNFVPGRILSGPGIDATGQSDSTSGIAGLIGSGGVFYGKAGATYKVSSLALPSNIRLIGNGARFVSTITGAGAGILTVDNGNNIVVEGWRAGGALSTIFVKIRNSSDVHVLNNHCLTTGIATSTSLTDTYSGSSEGACRRIEVRGNTGVASNAPNGYSAICLRYTSDSIVAENNTSGYGHGVMFWGGDSASDGSGVRKSQRITIANNVINDVGQGGIWGSMGREITVIGNTCRTGGDVGIDFEGCQMSSATGNTVENFANGGLTTFFSSTDVLFSSNVVEQDSASGAAYKAFGPGASVRVHVSGNIFRTANPAIAAIFTDQGALADSAFVNNRTVATGSGGESARFNQCPRIRYAGNSDTVTHHTAVQHLGGVDAIYEDNRFQTTADTSTSGQGGGIVWTWLNSTQTAQRLRARGNAFYGFVTSLKDDCGGDNASYALIEGNLAASIWHRGTTGYQAVIATNRTSNPNVGTPVTAV